jgi:enterobactin synthetase component D
MPGSPDSATGDVAREAVEVERLLCGWFPANTFVKAAPIGDRPIHPEEAALMANAVEHRRLEFATGRWLAREGLRHFGLPDAPIPMQRLRNPMWPSSVLGAISHDGDLCAAAILYNTPFVVRGIGFDLISLAQRTGRMEELAPMFVVDAAELACVVKLCTAADSNMLLFSLKESIIKAMTFRLDRFIDMRELAIRHTDGFDIHFEGSVTRAELFAAVTDQYLLTAAIVR